MNIEKYQIILIAFIFIIIGGIIWNFLLSKIKRILIRKRFKKGKSGEIKAKSYLQKKGYKILIEQPSLNTKININKKSYYYLIRADFIVEKKGKLYLIEVKTGKEAVDPMYTNTRRQLFEYFHLFNFDKLLLINANNFEITEIDFPDYNLTNSKSILNNFITGFFIGILFSSLFLIIYYSKTF